MRVVGDYKINPVYIKGSDNYSELADADFKSGINFVKAYCDRSFITVKI